ncbi:MAG: hypothetical protein U0528_13025 [Anaerolineae bacterium]
MHGSRRELARLLTRVENDQAVAELNELYPHTGKAHIVGITGAPGTGKAHWSTRWRALPCPDRTVAILAVDPSVLLARALRQAICLSPASPAITCPAIPARVNPPA